MKDFSQFINEGHEFKPRQPGINTQRENPTPDTEGTPVKATKSYNNFLSEALLLEYDRSLAAKSLGKKFTERMKADRIVRACETPEQALEKLEPADPTPNKQYMQWLIRAFQNGSPMEDLLSRGRDKLAKFGKLALHKKLKPEHRDVGRIPDLHQLETAMDSYEDEDAPQADKGQSEEILNNDEVRIIHLKDEAAAKYYGQNTKWCTAAREHSMYTYYAKKGEMYVLIPKHAEHAGEKYQLHFAADQYTDEQDRTVKSALLIRRFPAAVQTLTQLGLKHGLNRWTKLKINHTQLAQHMDKELDAGTIGVDMAIKWAKNQKQRSKKVEDLIVKKGTAQQAYRYAAEVVGGPWPEGEPIIAKHARWANDYAHILRGRFHAGEPQIAKAGPIAVSYSTQILKKPWPEAEKAIAKDGDASALYGLRHNMRFKAGEKAMVNKATDYYWQQYQPLMGGPDKDVEKELGKHLAKEPGDYHQVPGIRNGPLIGKAVPYAVHHKVRVPDAERHLMRAMGEKLPNRATMEAGKQYRDAVLGGQWPEFDVAHDRAETDYAARKIENAERFRKARLGHHI